jgi:hypothetical protein
MVILSLHILILNREPNIIIQVTQLRGISNQVFLLIIGFISFLNHCFVLRVKILFFSTDYSTFFYL